MSGLQEQKENKHLGDNPAGVKGGRTLDDGGELII
jgi:hypothetical protein